jgi:hypothetical protein
MGLASGSNANFVKWIGKHCENEEAKLSCDNLGTYLHACFPKSVSNIMIALVFLNTPAAEVDQLWMTPPPVRDA